MCASILLSVKWNIGRISKVPLEIRKARSTTHSPWYWSITSSAARSVLVIYPFKPSHLQSSAIFSSLMLTSISLLISITSAVYLLLGDVSALVGFPQSCDASGTIVGIFLCPLFGIADNKTFAIGPLEFMADIIPFVQ